MPRSWSPLKGRKSKVLWEVPGHMVRHTVQLMTYITVLHHSCTCKKFTGSVAGVEKCTGSVSGVEPY